MLDAWHGRCGLNVSGCAVVVSEDVSLKTLAVSRVARGANSFGWGSGFCFVTILEFESPPYESTRSRFFFCRKQALEPIKGDQNRTLSSLILAVHSVNI
jgi:hypothetical protein